MATDTENTGAGLISSLKNLFTDDFRKSITDGFMQAMKSDRIESDQRDQLAEMYASQNGQQPDPLFDQLKQNTDTMAKLSENVDTINKMFESFVGSGMAGFASGGQSSTANAVIQQGANEMNMPSGATFSPSSVGTLSSVSAAAPMPAPVTAPVETSTTYQNIVNAAGLEGGGNTVDNDRKLVNEEMDKQYKSTATPTLKKLEQALDQYMSGGLKVDVAGAESSGGGFGNLVGAAIGALGAGVLGFATGYLGKFAEMWGTVGKSFKSVWTGATSWLKDSALGKKMSQLGTKFRGAIDGGLAKLTELKTSFTNMLSGWKKAFSESMVGKGVKKVADTAKKVGGWFKNMAGKVAGKVAGAANTIKNEGVLKAAAKGVSAIASKGPVGAAVTAAKKVLPIAMKAAKKLPLVQAAGGVLDTAVNTYKVAKAGGSITDIMNTAAAGAIDTLADTLMIPEMINTVKGGIEAYQNGGGIGDVLKGAGKGMFKPRSASDISYGTGMIANIQHFAGNETETSKRIREAYNAGKGYDATGLTMASGAAGGFGHSAAIYKPAAGSMQNANEPTVDLSDKIPDSASSEADRVKAMTESLKEGVKEALLSPEVREANAQDAKTTGAAINGQLFGN